MSVGESLLFEGYMADRLAEPYVTTLVVDLRNGKGFPRCFFKFSYVFKFITLILAPLSLNSLTF